MSQSPRVGGIFTFPLKSGAGLDKKQSLVFETGLEGDREFILTDEHGKFLTQRLDPSLALVKVAKVGTDAIKFSSPVGHLSFLADGITDMDVVVWKDQVNARCLGDVSKLLPHRAGKTFLVRVKKDRPRFVSEKYGSKVPYWFADGFPLLVTSSSTLESLNREISREGAEPIPMSRFRPNIVIDGWDPLNEDHVEEFQIGGQVTVRLVKPCVRCIMTTIDQNQGVKSGKEPLNRLSRDRYSAQYKGPVFGWNGYMTGKPGSISIGDPVSISKFNPGRTIE